MKVLNVNQNISEIGGGVTRRIRDFAPYLEKLGVDVIAITGENTRSLPPGIKDNIYLPEINKPRSPKKDWTFIVDQVLNNNIDICHIHEVKNIKIIQYLINRLPVVIHLHNYSWWCPGSQLFYASSDDICSLSIGHQCITNAYVQGCNNRHPINLFNSILDVLQKQKLWFEKTHFVAGSEYMRFRAIQAGIPAEKVSLVYNGIDHCRFSQLSDPLDEDLEPGYLLYVGRFSKTKGIHYLLEAFYRIRYLNRKLVLVGDGYYQEEIRNCIQKLDLQNHVKLIGLKSGVELSVLYLNSSVVIVPSVWAEVFGNVGLEAMAASKPVVAFDVGGVSQWLKDNNTGFLVPRKDIDGLANKIAALIENPSLCKEMGEAGHKYFLANFTTERQSQCLLDTYNLVISNYV
jgi:glycosyltransferase involved in cell wall biosynthesis